MEFGILGPLQVRLNGQRVPLGGAKQRSLLAALLLESNHMVTVERLVELLWGRGPPATAANNLQVYISQLRQALEPERPSGTPPNLLLSQSSGYLLVVGPDQLDLYQFERLVGEGRRALTAGDVELSSRMLRAALALWRGPALADLPDSFARGERARLEELRLRALEDRIDADLTLGRHADLVGELEALAGQHPLRERLCGQLMLALYRSGRQAEASAAYQRAREVLAEERGMEPSPPLQKLLMDLLNQDPALDRVQGRQTDHEMSVVAPKTNLRLQLTSFIGREREVAEVRQLLGTTRLLTLLGAGGIGKTRLALAVASQLLEDYADGVWLVELAAVTDPALVPQIVLAALDFGADPGHTPMESLIGVLTTREMLCVIDNCEHLIEACARLANTLLTNCPRLRILATSRDVLRVNGESIWRVPSLETTPQPAAESPADLARLEAVQLFVDRAAAVRSSFRLTDDNAAFVARICQRIDGIPLAIELAAARVRGMSVAEIEERLEDCFQLLTGGSRVSTPRQRTLQATLDWSHDLLTDSEKRLFRRLSVFGGGFTLAGGETICRNDESGGVGDSVLDDLSNLVDKSLVVWDDGSDASGRYRLLEPIRQYAYDRLSECGETDWSRRRHALFYIALAEEVSRGLRGRRQPVWVARVEVELDNFRAACDWALQQNPAAALRLVLGLDRYWTVGHFVGEGRNWLNRALQTATDHGELRANGLYTACWWAFVQGDYDEARRLGRECLSLAQALGSALFSGQALTALACLAMAESREGWVDLSLSLCEQAEQHLRSASVPVTLARQLNNIGTVLQTAGNLLSAQAKLEEAVGLARALGDSWLLVNNLDGLASIEFDTGDTVAAEAHWLEALALAGEIRSRVKAMLILIGLGQLAQLNGQPVRCLRLLGAGASLQKRMGWALSSASPAMARALVESQAAAQGLIGTDAAETAWREGNTMSLAEAVQYGLGKAPGKQSQLVWMQSR